MSPDEYEQGPHGDQTDDHHRFGERYPENQTAICFIREVCPS